MVTDLKPKLAAGGFLLASAILFWLASPDLSAAADQPYIRPVLLFVAVVGGVSLYFVYDILSEVTGR